MIIVRCCLECPFMYSYDGGHNCTLLPPIEYTFIPALKMGGVVPRPSRRLSFYRLDFDRTKSVHECCPLKGSSVHVVLDAKQLLVLG